MEDFSMMKVLIVDDTEENIDLLLEILGEDFDISVAMDGEQALEIVEEDLPDLVLLDIMMPGMDGYEVCQRIKANEKTCDIPIIFLTAMVEVDDETKGLEMGAVDYITKPISPPIVLARVKTQLQIKKAYEIIESQKKRMEKELDSGRNIQMSMVPQTFPPFPDRHEVSIHAKLKPAREVGGDFYDFFFIDENHLCVCMGDVSGKGVPAALFMAVARTLIRAHAYDSLSTASVITRVNDELNIENRQAMFVTLFIGILDLEKGEFTFTNAGHNPSLLVKTRQAPERLKTVHGIPLGIFPEIAYDQETINLDQGDLIFMYTDGVTDTHNEKKEFFGDLRLDESLSLSKKEPVEVIVENVIADIKRFQGNAEQFDDITVMALKYNEKSQVQD
jgi:sigma-B regulation protein RsbU (phosphoserine phosphatase)